MADRRISNNHRKSDGKLIREASNLLKGPSNQFPLKPTGEYFCIDEGTSLIETIHNTELKQILAYDSSQAKMNSRIFANDIKTSSSVKP